MYSEEYLGGAIVPQDNKSLTPLSLVASPGVYCIWLVGQSIQLTRLMALVDTQTLTGLIAPVVNFYRRPTYGSTSGEVLIGSLTIPSGSTVGQVIYKNVESGRLKAGECLVAKIGTTGTDGGTAAGKVYCLFNAILRSEDPRNEALMVASA